MSVCRGDNANVWIKIFIFPQADHGDSFSLELNMDAFSFQQLSDEE